MPIFSFTFLHLDFSFLINNYEFKKILNVIPEINILKNVPTYSKV